jgi:hypothetical protein
LDLKRDNLYGIPISNKWLNLMRIQSLFLACNF